MTATVIGVDALDDLLAALRGRGFRVLGPTVRDGAIVYDDLESAGELPIGWTDRQDGGTYRLERRADEARFGYAVGPHSWKRFLFPPRVRLWRARRNGDGAPVDRGGAARRRRRSRSSASARASCTRSRSRTASSSAARYVDRDYAARREGAFLVAVNCFEPGGTCFCVSMGTGPKVEAGLRPRAHRAPRRRAPLPRRGRQRARRGGARRARRAARRPPADLDAAAASVESRRAADGADDGDARPPRPARAEPRASALGRRRRALPHVRQLHARLPDVLLLRRRGRDRPVRRRGRALARLGHAASRSTTRYIHGGSVRPSGRSRYRQWMTHKLGTWHDQFGSSGCVGCGRCITWCPVGIDITEEVAAIRATEEGRCRGRLRRLLADVAVLRGPRRRARSALLAGCAGNVHFAAGEHDLPRGRPGRRLLRDPPGQRRDRDVRADARAGDDRDDRGRARCSAGRGSSRPTAGTSTPARSSTVRATGFDGACLRAEVRRRPGARLRADGPLRAGADRAPAVDAAPTPRRLWQRRPSLSAAPAGAMAPAAVPRSPSASRTRPTPGR